MENKPIRRVDEMQGVSRDHHFALLLAFKINKGISLNIEPHRIKKYIKWFRKEHMIPHFEIEEQWMFPVLGHEHDKVQQALKEHVSILNLGQIADDYNTMHQLAEELKNHIRFEERDLFQEIQAVASPQQLKNIQENHIDNNYIENTEDVFWK